MENQKEAVSDDSNQKLYNYYFIIYFVNKYYKVNNIIFFGFKKTNREISTTGGEIYS